MKLHLPEEWQAEITETPDTLKIVFTNPARQLVDSGFPNPWAHTVEADIRGVPVTMIVADALMMFAVHADHLRQLETFELACRRELVIGGKAFLESYQNGAFPEGSDLHTKAFALWVGRPAFLK